ncbi:Uncharacterised protein [Raoultella terrigena]|uniref:Uncharacterized protein n=1 Tax=Raoultella terrigena TaxID=577 RepID=A0A4U9DDH1_RAOTE|nr:Uncharacterised protein [Raoultella terrigena]
MNGTNAGIKQGLHGGIGMRCGSAVVRVIDHHGDARVNSAQRRQQVANIDIGRTVIFSEGEVRGVAVVVQAGGVWVNAAQLSFPCVTMRIDHSRHGDHVGGINDMRTLHIKVLAHGGNR